MTSPFVVLQVLIVWVDLSLVRPVCLLHFVAILASSNRSQCFCFYGPSVGNLQWYTAPKRCFSSSQAVKTREIHEVFHQLRASPMFFSWLYCRKKIRSPRPPMTRRISHWSCAEAFWSPTWMRSRRPFTPIAEGTDFFATRELDDWHSGLKESNVLNVGLFL